MSEESSSGYRIRMEGNRLIFTTPSFRVGPESVLHSGIYNREFSSMLGSAAAAGAIYVMFMMNSISTMISAMVFILVFAAGFLFFRKFIFKESLMEVVFDAGSGKVKIFTSWIAMRLRETIAIKDIEKISIERMGKEVKNPDAVQFVEKIAAQHGTAIPGFGQEKVLFLLHLHLTDGGRRTIYSDSSMQDVMSAYDEIKGFLKI